MKLPKCEKCGRAIRDKEFEQTDTGARHLNACPVSSHRSSTPARFKVSCDQCQMLSINGVACHEIGCQNSGSRWENGEWVKYYECFECGCDVKKGDICGCQEPEEPEETEYDICECGRYWNECTARDGGRHGNR